jgi:hypothetical protein
MTDEQRPSYDDVDDILERVETSLARIQTLLDSAAVRRQFIREVVEADYNKARNYFSGASLAGAVATGVATNSFVIGVAAGIGLKGGTRGLEYLSKANAVTQHYAGLLTGVEAANITDEALPELAAAAPEGQDQEPSADA